MTTPHTDNLSGKPTLGRYTLLREVARSNDIVYEAIDPVINRRLAVKELNIAATLGGQARRERIERFFREGRAAGAMNHPNIVTIFEIGEDAGRFFIAMEFLEGQSLRDRLATAGMLPLHEAVATTVALCSALSYAHELGVVHRDIKPDNVHIVPTAGGHTVKLTDFGIARILGEDSLTMAGQVFGTPSYMSPEQVTGAPLDGRTDQFSLAVLLYEMLTGRKPFTGDTVVTITYRIIHDPVPPPPGVPLAIAQVIERAMAKDARSRFATVAEFGSALLAAVAAPVVAPPFMGVGGATPGAITPTGTNAQSTQAYAVQHNAAPRTTGGQRTNPTQPPQPAPRQSNTGAIAVAVFVLLAVISGAGYALKLAFEKIQVTQSRDSLVKLVNRGAALAGAKDYEGAVGFFKQVRESRNADPVTRANAANNEAICYRMLGQKAQASGDLANAEMWFTKATEVSPADAIARAERDAVRSRRGATAPVVAASPAPAKVDPNNPLAGLLTPSPAPGSNAVPAPSPSAFAPGVVPGTQTTGDFAAANAKRAADAQGLLDRGDVAMQAGRFGEAAQLWREAVSTGPGSAPAQTAQSRIERYASGGDL